MRPSRGTVIALVVTVLTSTFLVLGVVVVETNGRPLRGPDPDACLDLVEHQIRRYCRDHGHAPSRFVDLRIEAPDPLGGPPLRYVLRPDGAYELRFAGPDDAYDTDDDWVRVGRCP